MGDDSPKNKHKLEEQKHEEHEKKIEKSTRMLSTSIITKRPLLPRRAKLKCRRQFQSERSGNKRASERERSQGYLVARCRT